MRITRRGLIAALIGAAAAAPAVAKQALTRLQNGRLTYHGTKTGRWSAGAALSSNIPKSRKVIFYPREHCIDYWSCTLTDKELNALRAGADPATIRPDYYQRIPFLFDTARLPRP